MIRGLVTEDGVPTIGIPIDGQEWLAAVDTGFNGFLELPESLRGSVGAQFIGLAQSMPAAGRVIVEASYEVEFPFDGQQVEAEATFASGKEILIGTALLAEHRLQIDFSQKTVFLARVSKTD